MAGFQLLAGGLMIGAAILLLWYVRPIDGKVSPRLKPSIEPYAAVAIIGLTAFDSSQFCLE